MMNSDDVIGAVWSPEDGRVGPSDLCAALVKGAKSKGARIFEQTGVTGIKTRDNRIIGVETTQGEIDCDAIALCSGLWSRKNAAMAGVEVPVWPCEHYYLLTNPIDGINGNLPTLSDHDSHLYIRDDSGGLLVGCFEPMGKAIDPDQNRRGLRLPAAARRLGSLRTDAGKRDASPPLPGRCRCAHVAQWTRELHP